MRKPSLFLLNALVALVAYLLVPTVVFADWWSDRDKNFQFAVKFVCGTPSSPKRVVHGFYATAINILNTDSRNTQLKRKVVSALNDYSANLPDKNLDEGKATEIDCDELLPTGNAFDKGFVLIGSDEELSVTTVYTVAPADDETANSIDVEQINPISGSGSGSRY
jgi:hypothetical protein